MKITVFGLTITSIWNNTHAGVCRALLRALSSSGVEVFFFEKYNPEFAGKKDFSGIDGVEHRVYDSWEGVRSIAQKHVRESMASIVLSSCPEGVQASRLCLSASPISVFYDLDSSKTLGLAGQGRMVPYLPEGGLTEFDIVISEAGGPSLNDYTRLLGAKAAVPLYRCADVDMFRPLLESGRKRDIAYIGDYSTPLKESFDRLFLGAARMIPEFRLGASGEGYTDISKHENIEYSEFIAEDKRPEYICSSSFALSLTHPVSAAKGYCPGSALFEACACGTPVLSDDWEGIERFFEPGREIIVVRSAEDIFNSFTMPLEERARIGLAARVKSVERHSSQRRAEELMHLLEGVWNGSDQLLSDKGAV